MDSHMWNEWSSSECAAGDDARSNIKGLLHRVLLGWFRQLGRKTIPISSMVMLLAYFNFFWKSTRI
jgi:hypothetical protein